MPAVDFSLNNEIGNDRYEIACQIDSGGMALIYKAWDRHLETDVVVKIPRPEILGDANVAARFAREIRSLVRLSHPCIVPILDVGESAGKPFFVMRYLTGGNLRMRQIPLSGGGAQPMSLEDLALWLPGIAHALDFIHRKGFVHRDVKPENILFDAQSHPFLSDFGIAKAVADAAGEDKLRSTMTAMLTGGGFVGTPAYMSPEMVLVKEVDGRADQYALAVVVYEMLAGKLPFNPSSSTAAMVQQATEPPAPLHTSRPDLPRGVSDALQRALAKNPDARFSTCEQFCESLLAAASSRFPVEDGSRKSSNAGAPAIPCPACRKPLRVSGSLKGRRVPCPVCKTLICVSADGQQLDLASPAAEAESLPKAPAAECQPTPSPVHQPTPTAPLPPSPTPPAPTPPRASAPWSESAWPPDRAPRSRPRSVASGGGRRWSIFGAAAAGSLALAIAIGVFWSLLHRADPSRGITRENVVKGTLEIDFATRRRKGEVARGALDIHDFYKFDVDVDLGNGSLVNYSGDLKRKPLLELSDGSERPAGLDFRIHTGFKSRAGSSTEKPIGDMSGEVFQQANGEYEFRTLSWRTRLGAVLPFKGDIIGMALDNDTSADRPVTLRSGKNLVVFPVKKPDPIVFQKFIMPPIQALEIPQVEVDGELVYSHETDSYICDNLTFNYGDGKDLVLGMIQWRKDTGYVANGKSEYVFHLTFLDDEVGRQQGERIDSKEEPELEINQQTPSLYGLIRYVDTGEPEIVDGETNIIPHESKVTFALNAIRLRPRQIHTFLRIWILMSGPVNDE